MVVPGFSFNHFTLRFVILFSSVLSVCLYSFFPLFPYSFLLSFSQRCNPFFRGSVLSERLPFFYFPCIIIVLSKTIFHSIIHDVPVCCKKSLFLALECWIWVLDRKLVSINMDMRFNSFISLFSAIVLSSSNRMWEMQGKMEGDMKWKERKSDYYLREDKEAMC